jgi:hypothetical protein
MKTDNLPELRHVSFFVDFCMSLSFIMKTRLKRCVVYFMLAASISLVFQECIFRRKNRCDSCPGLVKQKKVKKATKGSI